MPRCQRCRSGSAIRGYCARCQTWDPFPWSRRIAYAAVLGACALAAAAVLLAAR